MNKIKCENCGKKLVFSDKERIEMIKEYEELYGYKIDDYPISIICDACFQKLIKEYPIEQFKKEILDKEVKNN